MKIKKIKAKQTKVIKNATRELNFEKLEDVTVELICCKCGIPANGKWRTHTDKKGRKTIELRCKKHENSR